MFKAMYPLTGRTTHQGFSNTKAKVRAHSNRKYGKSKALCQGLCTETEAENGCWKDMARASAVYAYVVLPYPNPKVAFKICHGGPSQLQICDNCRVGNDWIAANVSPCTKAFGRNDAATLGHALLWACFDSEARKSVDICLQE